MSKADEYNHREILAGRLTAAHITELVSFYQFAHELKADGMAGPVTRALLDTSLGPLEKTQLLYTQPFLKPPLPRIAGVRKPVVTSAFRTTDRPNHNGQDWFYPWKPGDQPDFVGDAGAAGRQPNGDPKWVVPYGVQAIAAAGGVVQIAGNSKTGYRCWIDHGNGWRTGYFHLLDLRVSPGQKVIDGEALGSVGDNPADHDGRHLHFELSPVDRYAPVDPALWFIV